MRLTKRKIPYSRSFASHPKNKNWDWIANKFIGPESYSLYSHKICHFKCDMCGHKLQIRLYNVCNGHWCTYCSKSKVCLDNSSCDHCFNRSFASHPYSINRIWEKNKVGPNHVSLNSNKEVHLICPDCKHNLQMSPASVNQGHRCKYCAKFSPEICLDKYSCTICTKKSFLSSEYIDLWDWMKNGLEGKDPRFITKFSGKYRHFICKSGHSWISRVCNISNGKGCPDCVNKTERKLLEFLHLNFSSQNVKSQVKFEWSKKSNGHFYKYDFYIKKYNVIIELDGRQHFVEVPYFKTISLQENQENDTIKNQLAIRNRLKMIRICQRDV